MAGSKEQSPEMSEQDIIELIENESFIAVERDSEYNTISL
jgi:2-iminoacetate synthase ThiH